MSGHAPEPKSISGLIARAACFLGFLPGKVMPNPKASPQIRVESCMAPAQKSDLHEAKAK
jgi:hypothetical protein